MFSPVLSQILTWLASLHLHFQVMSHAQRDVARPLAVLWVLKLTRFEVKHLLTGTSLRINLGERFAFVFA